jgi:hypothetical protein
MPLCRRGLSYADLSWGYAEWAGKFKKLAEDASETHEVSRRSGLSEPTLRALGLGIDDMRTYQANRSRGGRAVAAEQCNLLRRHARFQNSATAGDMAFYAARSYSSMRPPRVIRSDLHQRGRQ